MTYLLETKSAILNPGDMLNALMKEGRVKLAAGPLGLSVSVFVGSVQLISAPKRKPTIPMITTFGDFTLSDEGIHYSICSYCE